MQAEYVAQLPAFYTQDTPASANEMWQKLHGDPMFAVSATSSTFAPAYTRNVYEIVVVCLSSGCSDERLVITSISSFVGMTSCLSQYPSGA